MNDKRIKELRHFAKFRLSLPAHLDECLDEIVKLKRLANVIVEMEPDIAEEDDIADVFDGYFLSYTKFLKAIQQAWPQPKGYAEDPMELIVELINERDDLRAAVAELVAGMHLVLGWASIPRYQKKHIEALIAKHEVKP